MNRRALMFGAVAMVASPGISHAEGTPTASPEADEWAHADWLVEPAAF